MHICTCIHIYTIIQHALKNRSPTVHYIYVYVYVYICINIDTVYASMYVYQLSEISQQIQIIQHALKNRSPTVNNIYIYMYIYLYMCIYVCTPYIRDPSADSNHPTRAQER